MYRYLMIAMTLLLFTACGPRYGDFFPCHDDGTIKPRVALLPIKDASGCEERADELMRNIRYKLMDRGDLYVYSQEAVDRQLQKMGGCSFFNTDISFAKYFGGADFVVATELLEYSDNPYGNVEEKCIPPHLQRKNVLTLKLRVRMIDLRGQEPTLVMQEIMSRTLLVPNYITSHPEHSGYFKDISSRLGDEFVRRLEEITWSLR